MAKESDEVFGKKVVDAVLQAIREINDIRNHGAPQSTLYQEGISAIDKPIVEAERRVIPDDK